MARSRTSSAPTPGGPPSLCADSAMKSASGNGALPALCAQSASSNDPAARIFAARRSSGWRMPVSLLTAWIATSAGPRASTASSASSSISPSRPTGSSIDPAPIACGHDGMFGRAMRPSGDARAAPRPSRPPRSRRDVKMTSCRHPSASASVRALPRARPAPPGPRHAASWDWPTRRSRAPSPRAPAEELPSSRHGRGKYGQPKAGNPVVA